jgi:hypothetical protein
VFADRAVFVVRVGLCGLSTCRCGLAICFGASTVTLGSWGTEPVPVCDIAVPLKLQSNAVETSAIAEDATKLDDNLMTVSPKVGRTSRPNACTVAHIFN